MSHQEAFMKGFTEEIEKIAILPALGAVAIPALKAIGTGAAMEAGSRGIQKLTQGKKKPEGMPTV